MATIKNYQSNLNKDVVSFLTELQAKFPDAVITSGYRENAVTKFGKKSHHATGNAVDLRLNPNISDWLYNTKEGVLTLNKYGLGMIDEGKAENKKWGNAIHVGKDSVPIERAKARYKELFGQDYSPQAIVEEVAVESVETPEVTNTITNLENTEENTTFVEETPRKVQEQEEEVYEGLQIQEQEQPQQVYQPQQQPEPTLEEIYNQVSEFVDTPIAQQGVDLTRNQWGNLNQEQWVDVEKQRDWLNDWNSNRNISGKPTEIKTTTPFMPYVAIDDLNTRDNGRVRYGEYDLVSDKLLLDVNYRDKEGIPLHEQTHKFQRDLREAEPNKYQEYIAQPINKHLKKSGNFTPYQLDPDETHSELNRLRYNLDFKPNQVIDKSDLENADLNDYNFKQFNTNELLDILNSTASLQKKQVNNLAQQGGNYTEAELNFLSDIAIKDNQGQYNHPGKVTEINSPNITMKGLDYSVLGISKETGEQIKMQPNKDYFFKNTKNVIEIPTKKNKNG